MGSVTILPRYTYEDYKEWRVRLWEIIDGGAFPIESEKDPAHQRVLQKLVPLFKAKLENFFCYGDPSVIYLIEDDNVLKPDMLVLAKELKKEYADFPPVMIVEVLSQSTKAIDQVVKFQMYQSQGIRYYLIIDPGREEAEIYELSDGQYKMTSGGKDFKHDFMIDGCKVSIDFKEVWK
jgi:Uma2 family endonuclease